MKISSHEYLNYQQPKIIGKQKKTYTNMPVNEKKNTHTGTISHVNLIEKLSGFTKLHMGLVVLVKNISVLIHFLVKNTNLVSVLSKIFPNFAGHFREL
jgi:hypothetical protein